MGTRESDVGRILGPEDDPLADYTPDWQDQGDDPLADYTPDWQEGREDEGFFDRLRRLPPVAEEGRLGGLAAALGRGAGQIIEGVGGTLEMMRHRFEQRERPEFMQQVQGPQVDVGAKLSEVGRAVQEHPRLARSSRAGEQVFDPGNIDWWIESGGEVLPQLGSQVALALTTGGTSQLTQFAAFAAPVFALEGGLAYNHAREKLKEQGYSEAEAEERASGAALLTGVGATALERIPFSVLLLRRVPGAGRVFSNALAGRLAHIGSGAAAEGVTEAAQEAWADAVAYAAQTDPAAFQDWQQRYMAAGALGAAVGGGVTATLEAGGVEAPVAEEEAPPPAEPAERPLPFAAARGAVADVISPENRRQRDELRRAAETDVTGVGNKAAFERARPAAEADPEISVVAFDANNFGQVNKRPELGGHARGDELAQQIADGIRQAAADAGAGDRVFRVGGDEFVVLAPTEIAEDVRDLAEETIGDIVLADDLTVSVSGTVGQTFAEADDALQARKRARKGLPEAPPPIELEAAQRAEEESRLDREAGERAQRRVDEALATPEATIDQEGELTRALDAVLDQVEAANEGLAEEGSGGRRLDARTREEMSQHLNEAAEAIPALLAEVAAQDPAFAAALRERVADRFPDLVSDEAIAGAEEARVPPAEVGIPEPPTERDPLPVEPTDETGDVLDEIVLEPGEAPWEQTQRIFQHNRSQLVGGVPVLNANDKALHRALVEAALREGRDVPAEVLQDYPDLIELADQESVEAERLRREFMLAEGPPMSADQRHDMLTRTLKIGDIAHVEHTHGSLGRNTGTYRFDGTDLVPLFDKGSGPTQAVDYETGEFLPDFLLDAGLRIFDIDRFVDPSQTVLFGPDVLEALEISEAIAAAEAIAADPATIVTPERVQEQAREALEEAVSTPPARPTPPPAILNTDPLEADDAGELPDAGREESSPVPPADGEGPGAEGPRGAPGRARRERGRDAQPDRVRDAEEGPRPGGVPREGQVRAEPEPGSEGDRVAGPDSPAGSGRIGRWPNYRIGPDQLREFGSPAERARRNLDALRTLRRVQSENRQATPEEQDVLIQYTGWGAVPQIFNPEHKLYEKLGGPELKELLDEEEYAAARRSTTNAHYTQRDVVTAMHDVLKKLGVNGGRYLEPAAGIGHFFGLQAPEHGRRFTRWSMVELDKTSGAITRLLYPRADVQIAGFQDVDYPASSFDVVISNVPFGDFGVYDPRMKDRPALLTGSIHNYFFARALDVVRPGGIVAFLTSRYTMDARDPGVRRWLAQQADLVGAVRLPSNTFRKNAGTEVVTDLIVLQKRAEPLTEEAAAREPWVTANGYEIGGEFRNAYYDANPDHILGREEATGTMRRAEAYNVVSDEDVQAIAAKIPRLFPSDIYTKLDPAEAGALENAAPVVPSDIAPEGSWVMDGDEPAQVVGGKLKKGHIGKGRGKNVDRVTRLIGLRDAVQEVLRTQTEDLSEAEQEAARQVLNDRYEAFVKKHGRIRQPTQAGKGVRYLNLEKFRTDPHAELVAALEVGSDEELRKAAIFERRVVAPPLEPVIETTSDALLAALNELGRVDLNRVAELRGLDQAEVREELRGTIFEDPLEDGRYVMRDEYLSGNVRVKLEQAQVRAEQDPRFQENVEALEQVQPEDLLPSQISVGPGASWIPTDDVARFVGELLEVDPGRVGVTFIEGDGAWKLNIPRWVGQGVQSTEVWGTPRVPFGRIFQDVLNQRPTTVYDLNPDGSRSKNVAATLAAAEMQQKIKDRFAEWVWEDQARAERLVRVYNDLYNNLVARDFDGSHLTFPGMSATVELQPHQRAAVWRILSEGNTLLAHAVGAGKTYAMIAAGMESKRLGLARKPAYVVPNHMLNQFASDILQLYPAARVLTVDKKKMSKKNRRLFLASVATEDWDAVVMTHSVFGRIPMSPDFEAQFIEQQITEYAELIRKAKEDRNRDLTKELEKAKQKREKRLKQLADMKKDQVVTFEQAGIDMLFVDEAHAFKNLEAPGQVQIAKGRPSKRAFDLFLKSRYLDGLNPGRGLVFATATPISNAMVELYTMQRFLALDRLEAAHLTALDSWVAQFANSVTVVELDPTATSYRVKQRYASYKNAPELSRMFRQFSDVKLADELNLPAPAVKGGNAITIDVDATDAQIEYIQEIGRRAEAIRSGAVDKEVDNMLKLTTDGMKAALDMRLIDPEAEDHPDSKINRAVDNIAGIWRSTSEARSTQLVFIDRSAPKDAFNVYDDIKAKLLEAGVPASEIAYIHDANTDNQKAALFAKVRAGRVRVLMGSTEKMGVGTNVQDKVIALHHIDAPWRPSDIEQRDGRAIRQGNENPEVAIYRYVTVGTFDAYMWQMLERKAGYIDQMMRGDPSVREIEEVSDRAFSYAETKAITSGNPLVMEKAQVDADVQRLSRLKKSHEDQVFRAKRNQAELPGRIDALERRLPRIREDIAAIQDTKGKAFQVRIGKKRFTSRADAAKELLATVMDAHRDLQSKGDPETIGSFAGFEIELRAGKGILREPQVALVGKERYALNFSIEQTSTGMLASLEAGPDKVRNMLPTVEQVLENARADLERFQELAAKPFDRQEDFEAAVARQKEINAELGIGKQDDAQLGEVDPDDDTVDPYDPEAGFLDLGALFGRASRVEGDLEPESLPFASAFPEVEARIQAAKGAPVKGLLERAREAVSALGNSFRRSFKYVDPNAGELEAMAQDILRRLVAAPAWSKAVAFDNVSQVVEGLDADQVDLFTRVLIADDILKDVENGLYGEPEGRTGVTPAPLPFGYESVTQLTEDAVRWRALANNSPEVTAALERRARIAGALTRALVEEKLLPGKVLDDPRYYHRQVMKYLEAKDFQGTGLSASDVRLKKRGFQRARLGGTDFNTAFQEAEFEWMAHALDLLARKEALGRLEQIADIKDALKREAKARNEERFGTKLVELGYEAQGPFGTSVDPIDVARDVLKPYRQRIAMASANLYQLASEGMLDDVSGFDGVIEAIVEAYGSWQAENAELEPSERRPFAFSHPDFFRLLSALIEQQSEGAVWAATIFKAIDQRNKMMDSVLGDEKLTWEDLVPPDYAVWQPEKGNRMYPALTVEERVLNRALEDGRALTREEVAEALVLGGPKEQWVLPDWLARQMDELRPAFEEHPVERVWVGAQSSWKQWVLLSPYRALRYNLNNMSGDLDIAFAYDPKIITHHMKGAARDLFAVLRRKASPELRREILELTRLGVVQSGLTIAEIPDINEEGVFQSLASSNGNIVQRGVKRYWKSVRDYTTMRENILRVAAYRRLQERHAAGERNLYGASDPRQVDPIEDTSERLAKVARELIGDYGNVSVAGQWLRRHMFPFYSWIEINAPRYYRLLKNLPVEGQGRTRLAGVAAKKAATAAAVKLPFLVVKMNVLFILMNLWNNLFFPDEEEDLGDARRQLHLIVGRRRDGTVISLRIEGAMSDALEWFNLQDYPADVRELLSGDKTVLDEAAEALKAPIERLVNSYEPFSKTTFELTMGRSTWPSVFEEGTSFGLRGRPIRDRVQHAARLVTPLDMLWDRVTNKPRRPAIGPFNILGRLLLYQTDPGEAAYWTIRDRANDWLEEQGREFASVSPTRRANALYYMRQAARYGDDERVTYWMEKYFELGGTPRGLEMSVARAAPLGAIARRDRQAFIATLTPRELDALQEAIEWYGETSVQLTDEEGQ